MINKNQGDHFLQLLRFAGIISVAAILAGCAFGQKHAINAADPMLQLKGDGDLAVATHDQRPYVISGDKPVTFVGLQRAGFGNPYDVNTASGSPLADELTDTLARALQRSGFAVRQVDTQPQHSKAELVSRLTGDSRAVLLTITELKSDTYNNAAFIYDMDLEVLGTDGEVLAKSSVEGRDNLGGNFFDPAGHAKEAVPAALEKKLESLLNDSDVAKALEDRGHIDTHEP